MFEMAGVLQLARDSGHVVVADEGHRHEHVQKIVVPRQCMVELVEIAVVQAAPDRLPQFVLRDGVESGIANVHRVVAVDDLADEPCVAELLADAWQHLSPEAVGYRVGGVEAPAIGSAAQPVRHHIDDVVDDVGVVVVQRDELAVALERLVSAAGGAEPRGVMAVDRVAVTGEVRPDMVEDTVEQDAQAASVRLGDKLVEVRVVAEPRIDPLVVGGVVAVSPRLEDRPERDS